MHDFFLKCCPECTVCVCVNVAEGVYVKFVYVAVHNSVYLCVYKWSAQI